MQKRCLAFLVSSSSRIEARSLRRIADYLEDFCGRQVRTTTKIVKLVAGKSTELAIVVFILSPLKRSCHFRKVKSCVRYRTRYGSKQPVSEQPWQNPAKKIHQKYSKKYISFEQYTVRLNCEVIFKLSRRYQAVISLRAKDGTGYC